MVRLTTLKVKNAGPGRHPDGDGLYLLVRETGSRQFILRVQANGKRRDFGLGAAETQPRTNEQQAAAEKIDLLNRRSLTLAEARDKASAYRRMAKAGLDPVAERAKTLATVPSFEKAARACHEQMKQGWRNSKHKDSWLASLDNHIFPAIGKKPVDAITSVMVRDALAPIWLKIPDTAERLLQRIGVVLDFAHIEGWRPEETSLKSVRKGLPRRQQFGSHFEAMPYQDVPAFVQSLAEDVPSVGRDALRFTILTAVRSSETRFARWSEIDFEKATWTIPGTRMKMKETHVVPLAAAAVEILHRRYAASTSRDGFIFSATRSKAIADRPAQEAPISDMTMNKVMKESTYARGLREGATRRGQDPNAVKIPVVHGFRSSFTDWAAETVSLPKEVVDKALAHKLPDRVEAAYRRTDFFEKRRLLMQMWADYLAGVDKVVRLAATA